MKRNPLDEIEEIEEEADYVNDPVRPVDEVAAPPDQRFLFFTRSLPVIAVCWLILLLIMGLRIHFTSVISEPNAELRSWNQELENQKNNLTQQIQDMEMNWNEHNISRAQWSIDTYCPKDKGRTCTTCRKDWIPKGNSCYVYNNAGPDKQITWEEARERCRVNNANLAVAHNEQEKNAINDVNYGTGYWIGLRVEGGLWKWIDGSELIDSSWIGNPTGGHCAVFVLKQPWTSARCGDRKQWICSQGALSL